jgi:hypothetical protein
MAPAAAPSAADKLAKARLSYAPGAAAQLRFAHAAMRRAAMVNSSCRRW